MSWFFGFIGSNCQEKSIELNQVHDTPSCSCVGPNYYIQAGGPDGCVNQGHLMNGQGTWIVSGIGLDPSNFSMMDQESWTNFLSCKSPDLNQIDGHFVIAVIRENDITLHNDQLGLRTLYYSKWKTGVVFSTRSDWLASLFGGLNVNFQALGSLWTCFNQLSYRSQIHGISRLGQGGILTIKRNDVADEVQSRPWSPDILESDGSDKVFESLVEGYCNVKNTDRVCLGFSGGLDSRLLLSLGATNPYVLGPAHHPDTLVAHQIMKKWGRGSLRHENKEFSDLSSIIDQLDLRCRISLPVFPAWSTSHMQFFKHILQEKSLAIGGEYGELARRHYLNRLILFGGLNAPPKTIARHIQSNRVNFFSQDIWNSMMVGVDEEIATLCDIFPLNIDAENAADLICVRTRLPNVHGTQQAYLDSLCPYFSIFVQPSILKSIFHIPLALRRNAKLVRRIIKSRAPVLTKFPLVSETSMLPWFLPRKAAVLIKRIQAKTGTSYSDPRPYEFLSIVKPFVLDLLHSNSLRSNAMYDYNRLHQLISGYYEGNLTHANAVNWWLTFEFWRKNIENPTHRIDPKN